MSINLIELQKHVVITSIMLMSANQKCNTLASVIGIFCHSSLTPERVIKMLTHSGLCISVTSIHWMVSSLSNKSAKKICDISKDMLVSVAYDNFDMEFKSHLPTVESSGSTMKHTTSAIIFRLEHATSDDLKHSAMFWSTDQNNPDLAEHQKWKKATLLSCLHIIAKSHSPETSHDVHIIAWHF